MMKRDQKREHKLVIICQCRKQRMCSKSYLSKRQGQHWWSELFVCILTSFIPNEMCNQSDVVSQRNFTPSPHCHPHTHNWFPNTKRQTWIHIPSSSHTNKTITLKTRQKKITTCSLITLSCQSFLYRLYVIDTKLMPKKLHHHKKD